ncbi:MAG: CAP domain-containing protein [Paenirhodobacter sp.]|uniref:CAP domain-containing protein n=1 Tax=Paenirhodobacter sp. TaxID=1965326 RepID=UPI003D0F2FD2
MPHRPLLPTALALALLAGCATAPAPAPEITSQAASSYLPGRVIWTDGHGDLAVAAAGAARCTATSSAEAAAALAQTNAVRAQSGLPPLAINPALQRVAEKHACDMASRGLMTHAGSSTTGPLARAKQQGYRPRVISENIAAGAAGRFTLGGTLEQWGLSPKHRANITIARMKEFGIGHAVAADGKTVFWAAVYATR